MCIPERPVLQRVPNAGPARGVALVFRRELLTRLLSKAFVVPTILFAVMALAAPLLFGDRGDQGPASIGVATGSADRWQAAAGGEFEVTEIGTDAAALDAARTQVRDGELDALLVAGTGPASDGGGTPTVLVQESLDPAIAEFLVTTLERSATQQVALDAGAAPQELTAAATAAVPTVEALAPDRGPAGLDLVAGLAPGVVVVFLVIMWGTTLATGVVDEKASRVVEILLATIRPWQLLLGKVFAVTVLGLLQAAAIAVGALAGFLAGGGSVPALGAGLVVTGVVAIVVGVVLLSLLIAALAARVERQEDVGSALQPAWMLSLAPWVASVWLLNATDSVWLDIASIAPFTNVFTMPLRLAVESVPAWQVVASALVAAATLVAVAAFSGRVYAGSVLRSGGKVSLREAVSSS